jgi:hypothetical protein
VALKVGRFLALVLAALALTMEPPHGLELPLYTAASIAAAAVLLWLVRGRHPSFEWALVGASFLVLAFGVWLADLRPRWEYGHVAGFVLELLGFCALVVSTVVETTAEAPEGGHVHARVSGVIHAPFDRVAGLYADYAAWPRIFSKTIRGVRLVDEQGPTKTIEVEHVEGRVMNVMSVVSRDQIRLEEWKKRYAARFTNLFEPVPGGTRYSIVADVTLSGPFKILAPFVKPLVRSRMRRFVVDPLREVAELPVGGAFT